MLKAQAIHYELDSKAILKNVTVDVVAGEILVVLGPNGAGKSTLLKALTGEIPELCSKVILNGLTLNHYHNHQLAGLRAVMPQAIQLDFAFLVEEVVGMGVICTRKQSREQRILNALNLFDVGHLVNRNYLTLSGGEQQRVQLARVVAQILPESSQSIAEGRYLLLDECTSSLDLAHQQQVFKVLKTLAKQHRIGIVAVLHDLNLASQYADKALLLSNGVCHAYDEVDLVLTATNISQVYQCDVEVIPRVNNWTFIVPQ